MKLHILIIEDDPDLAEGIRYNLERAGTFVAQVVANSDDALRVALKATAALIILDVNLPGGMNGFELCRRLRAEKLTQAIPILMLTALATESDKIKGLELGADDYMTKPFSLRELTARVKALLRRAGYEETVSEIYDDGQLRIDYGGYRVICAGHEVRLTRKELGLLTLLTRNQGRVIPRERLLDEVWGMAYYGKARTLDVHISGLRKKLGACGTRIETVIGIGYRLRTSPVSPMCASLPEAVTV